MREYLHSSPTSTSFIAGGVAGAVSRTIVSPLERMKILFQIQGPGTASYTGVWSTLAKMWREEGWRGFMRGNGTNCIRIIPYSACQFAAYTTYKRVIFDLPR
jgi:solute carrier family 25 (mitochondrial phosphate transporter), member 23/24/25/41